MINVLICRHGHTDWIGRSLAGRLPAVHLSEHGRRQAAALAERLRNYTIDAIYSSPLERAVETAEPLAAQRGLPVEKRPALTEIDFGQWTGRTLESLEGDGLWRRFNTLRASTRPPMGELTLEVQTRMCDELERLRQTHADGSTVAVFSHQDTIKAAVAHYLGMSADMFERFEIGPASLTVLQLAEWGPKLVTLNSQTEV